MPLVPILRASNLRAWPKHDTGGVVPYVELSEALVTEYGCDAHTACWSAPNILRRLAGAAPDQTTVQMVAAFFDIDGPEHVCDPEWWAGEQPKIDALLDAHPGLFVFQSRGGYKFVGVLPEPVVITSSKDKSWTALYNAWVRYLARRFGIVADPIKDWTRLIRLPHAARSGATPERLETRGNEFAVGVWAPELTLEDTEEPITDKQTRVLALRMQDAPDLMLELFRARGWLGEAHADGKINIRCPRYEQHRDGSPPPWDPKDTSTVLLPANEEFAHGSVDCKHTACGHDVLSQAEWRGCFSKAELLVATERIAGTWSTGLLLGVDGMPRPATANVLHILVKHPRWAGVLAFDAFANRVIKTVAPPVREQDAVEGGETGPWTDVDTTRAACWLTRVLGSEPKRDRVLDAVVAAAHRNTVNPLREYLDPLEWDGEPRIDTLLVDYFGGADTSWARVVGVKWMISAVARAITPGCQVDTMLVLESKQGTRKSTGLEALCPNRSWFADSPLPIGDKDAFQQLDGKWIYEVGELDSFKGKDVTRIKSFVSARHDNYRAPYERIATDHMRQCVFAGTTNEVEYLEDRTGNRRFWPVKVGRVDIERLRRDRDQLWAEAVARYQAGEPWWLTEAEETLAGVEQAERTIDDPWGELIGAWLDGQNSDAQRKGYSVAEILVGALGFVSDRINRAATTRCGYCMRDLGWKPSRSREDGGVKVRRYYPVDHLGHQNRGGKTL